jgi:hypothetical protein
MTRNVLRSMATHLQTVVYLQIRMAPWILNHGRMADVFATLRKMRSLRHLYIHSADQWMQLTPDALYATTRVQWLSTLELYLGRVHISQLTRLLHDVRWWNTTRRIILHTNCAPTTFSWFRDAVRALLEQVLMSLTSQFVTWYNAFPIRVCDYFIPEQLKMIPNLRCVATSTHRPGFITG